MSGEMDKKGQKYQIPLPLFYWTYVPKYYSIEEEQLKQKSSKLSFIVPAYNEELFISDTLQRINAVAASIGQLYEVIVVNDASTDNTVDIARQHNAHVITVNNRQIAATRNAGAYSARGSHFFFIDADTLINETIILKAIETMNAGAVGGGSAFRYDELTPLYGGILQSIFVPLYRIRGLACGCFLFCTREAFEAVGGFNEKLYATEEAEISRSLKQHGKFVILNDSVTTSGRKFRLYSASKILSTLSKIALLRSRFVQERRNLELWYACTNRAI